MEFGSQIVVVKVAELNNSKWKMKLVLEVT